MGKIPDVIGPCGVYCGACPSFGRTCNGCGSEDRNQRRMSKWSCRVRRCCLVDKGLDLCSLCDGFPCKTYINKLPGSHPGDPRYTYRHEVIDNLRRIEEIGIEAWLVEQDEKWTCPECGGRVHMYHYRCSECGHDVMR